MIGSLLILGFGFITLAVFEQFLIDSEQRKEVFQEMRPPTKIVRIVK